jgi:hypothetical protein
VHGLPIFNSSAAQQAAVRPGLISKERQQSGQNEVNFAVSINKR